jgi:hypothetical protein
MLDKAQGLPSLGIRGANHANDAGQSAPLL